MRDERFQSVHDARSPGAEHVDIQDTIVVETSTSDRPAVEARAQREFEVVGIVEDSGSTMRYAVCYSQAADEFIVTDDVGTLLDDEDLAQEILDDFLAQTADSTEEEMG
ncbi:MAG: hypothetical protein DLM53_08105 [Candidatus Eremiobacter antarcticus]|nr:hypothetical protein [Candidatus Eremiobacteraeota bacterium]MBC5809208.1 hypothetical protein [Candidatus Eremiobacteraeota bacterium]PZR61752.1 MAG: hypothetical protein DLM53_08105 [Candidatus Eremiobacter sp. RRmetagenome_bin22]